MTPDNLQVTLSPEHLSISSPSKALRPLLLYASYSPFQMFSETAVPRAEQMLLLSLWTWVSTNEAFTDVCVNLQRFRMSISLQDGRSSVHMTVRDCFSEFLGPPVSSLRKRSWVKHLSQKPAGCDSMINL